MDKELLASAAEKLEIIDIVLHESSLMRNKLFDPQICSSIENVKQQNMLNLSAEDVVYKDDGEKTNIFRTYIELGIRAIVDDEEPNKPIEESPVLFTVEAVYRVDYLRSKKISKEEAAEFLKYNTVHNVWPFWRQHVFQTTKTANLPSLSIPLFRRTQEKVSKKSRKKLSTKK
jgi:hypothetical protein